MLGIDTALILTAYYAAFALRFDFQLPSDEQAVFLVTLPSVIAIQVTIYFVFRLNQVIWRYIGLGDLLKIVGASAAGMLVFAIANQLCIKTTGFPRSIYALDVLLQVSFLGGCRALRRLSHDIRGTDQGKRILIFGAGDAGEMIVRDMKHNPYYGYSPVGFIDDDPLKRGRRIHGVRVLGTRGNVPQIVADRTPDEILIAICRAEPRVLRDIVRSLEPYKLPIKTLPSLRDMINGSVTVSQIRNVSLADLLQRGPVGLDPGPLRRLIEGRRILVTGAGGSIGSELCRQLAALNAGLLLMFERYENALYTIDSELRDCGTKIEIVPLIGDVTDAARVRRVFEQYCPEMVLHAAAHKHVPLVQQNPCEAVKNNIRGTRITAETAARYGADRFILISTDKAVQPSSVMGATKRAAEFLVRHLSVQNSTCFAIVRFGNVLGSNGSVIPKFIEQIRAGDPVTVTHPEVERFFMMTQEAVNLVLHAATLDESGATYVLDMGSPIKLLDMARHLIRLSAPDQDIQIEFTGLRPGEKLREQLFDETERAERSAIAQVFKVIAPPLRDGDELYRDLIHLEALAARGEQDGVLAELARIVPGFCPPTTVPKGVGLAVGSGRDPNVR